MQFGSSFDTFYNIIGGFVYNLLWDLDWLLWRVIFNGSLGCALVKASNAKRWPLWKDLNKSEYMDSQTAGTKEVAFA